MACRRCRKAWGNYVGVSRDHRWRCLASWMSISGHADGALLFAVARARKCRRFIRWTRRRKWRGVSSSVTTARPRRRRRSMIQSALQQRDPRGCADLPTLSLAGLGPDHRLGSRRGLRAMFPDDAVRRDARRLVEQGQRAAQRGQTHRPEGHAGPRARRGAEARQKTTRCASVYGCLCGDTA